MNLFVVFRLRSATAAVTFCLKQLNLNGRGMIGRGINVCSILGVR